MVKNSIEKDFIVKASFTFYVLCAYIDFLLTVFFGDAANELNPVVIHFASKVGFTLGLALYVVVELSLMFILAGLMRIIGLSLAPSMFLVSLGVIHLQGGLTWVAPHFSYLYKVPIIVVLIVFLLFDLWAMKRA